jgi:hypothetical protein
MGASGVFKRLVLQSGQLSGRREATLAMLAGFSLL